MDRSYIGSFPLGEPSAIVIEDGKPHALDPRFDLARYSPDGFAWGYTGSGPAQLAIAILAHHFAHESAPYRDETPARRALALCDAFMHEVIAGFPQRKPFAIADTQLRRWVAMVETRMDFDIRR